MSQFIASGRPLANLATVEKLQKSKILKFVTTSLVQVQRQP
ncbi:hypothetical protein LCBD_p05 (plasmid) [Lacticaseibacillus paracasei]|uniref:Uncharacterized protein n=1 Tax=Lacticaseibacillus paracasei subsp. paracasei Lpp225 TaxID=1256225 RepID=S2N6F8_LACPA|nr:hypothetical protein LCBD_p05 [Lacticaseibacillus paracasei]EKQ23696.1 hypothetical protein LCAUCD174_0141 [Lacticaseibacillus paracasei]EPC32155.1 hypothetical protein Lpp223_2243 [Lacticaseibacillus paracasei subsp. paracasei Lpp223]EPC35550.1 hypothetical protein Lpp225_2872 [Lacticaseibacillus paracasei subsp. paracasei Lpp225]